MLLFDLGPFRCTLLPQSLRKQETDQTFLPQNILKKFKKLLQLSRFFVETPIFLCSPHIRALLPSPSSQLSCSFSLVSSRPTLKGGQSIVLSASASLSWAVVSDQVSPKKAIPMVPKPKSWVAWCGMVTGAGHTGEDDNVLWARVQACQLVLDLVDNPPVPWEKSKRGASMTPWYHISSRAQHFNPYFSVLSIFINHLLWHQQLIYASVMCTDRDLFSVSLIPTWLTADYTNVPHPTLIYIHQLPLLLYSE